MGIKTIRHFKRDLIKSKDLSQHVSQPRLIMALLAVGGALALPNGLEELKQQIHVSIYSNVHLSDPKYFGMSKLCNNCKKL